MIQFTIRSWSAWAPGVESQESWRRWAGAPFPLALEGTPELKFVPAMQRRRFSRATRMALQAAFDAVPETLRSEVSTVFASRHGEAEASVGLLRDIVLDLPLSPTAFSHSVHNTPAGLFSIAAQSGQASSSIAGARDTFCAGIVEALGLCERQRPRPTLLVVADEPVVEVFRSFTDETPAAFGLAMLLEEGESADGTVVGIELIGSAPDSVTTGPVLPQALRFLAWMLGDEATLVLPADRHAWKFRRFRA